MLAVQSAGNLYLRTEAETSPFRLISSFTKAEIVQEAFDVGHTGERAVKTRFLVASPASKTEPEVSDPDPGDLKDRTRQVMASILTLEGSPSLKTEPEVSDPDPGDVPVSSAVVVSAALRHVTLIEPLCRHAEAGDHGDTAICSTPVVLGRTETGELTNDWNDDRDVFSFLLEKVSKVEIVLVADVSGFAYELTGPTGQELAVDKLLTSDGASLHLVSTLAPGRYFFHVTGTSGAYAFNVVAYD